MKKQTKKYFIGFLIILSIVALIYFGGFDKSLSIFSNSGSQMSTTFRQIYSSDFSSVYAVTFRTDSPPTSQQACNTPESNKLDYSFMILHLAGLDNFPTGHYEGNLQARDVVINGIKTQSPDCSRQYKIVNYSATAFCKHHDAYYSFDCSINIKGQAVDENGNPVEAIYYGLNDGSLNVEILKEGVQCTNTQKTLCSENQNCIDNKCQDITPSYQPLIPRSWLNKFIDFFKDIWSSIFER